MQFVSPILFTEALEKLGDRTPIGSEMMSAEWADVPVALRERAMFSSQVESVRFLQRVTDNISDYLSNAMEELPDGKTALKMGSRAQFVDDMRAFALKEGMGPIIEEHAGGLRDITSEARLSLIFRMQTQAAGDYGQWRQGMDPAVLDQFPASRFVRVQAVKQERESHQRFEDQVYLKTDPIWAKVINEDFGVPWGPWAWGCGHDVDDVDRDEAEQLGVIKPGQELEPQHIPFNERLSASTKGIEPELIAKLRRDLGDQLVIEGEQMSWRTAAIPEPPKRENPVSDAIQVAVHGMLREDVEAGLAAIDRVHDDGELPIVELRRCETEDLGYIKPKSVPGGIAADYLAINNSGPWPTLTTIHEAGHLLDLEAIGPKGNLATRAADPDMMGILAAAEDTAAIRGLRKKLREAVGYDAKRPFAYLLKPEEIWARAYAQFVAQRARSIGLQRELSRAIESEGGLRQWTKGDFEKIDAAIEAMFKKWGWI